MTTVVLNTVTRKVEVFSSARDVQARAEIADHKAAADPHPQYLAGADLADVALSGDASDLTAGTVPDARMPNWTGYNLTSRTALEAANVPAAIDALSLLGHATVGDGGGAHYKRVALQPVHPNKIQSADGAWWEELFSVDVTVNIPSNFATLQEAIDRLSKQPVRQGARIILNIESGHALTAGLTVENGDYSRFTITSSNAEVPLAAAFPTTDAVMKGTNCRMPVWNILVNCGNQAVGTSNEVAAAIIVQETSDLLIGDGCGAKNVGGVGLFVYQNSRVEGAPVLSGCSGQALWVSAMSDAALGICDFTDSAHADSAVYVSRASRLSAVGSDFSGATGDGIRVRRSYVMIISGSAGPCVFNNCGLKAIRAYQCSIVIAHARSGFGTVISNCGGGIEADEGSLVDFRLGELNGVTGHAFDATNGAKIVATDAQALNVGGDVIRAQNGSIVEANGLIATAPGAKGITANAMSIVNAQNADLSGCLGTPAVEAIQGSIVNLSGANISNASSRALDAWRGGKIIAYNATVTGAGTYGAIATQGSEIIVTNANLSGAGSSGILASDSKISAQAANARKGVSDSSIDVATQNGSIISFQGGTGGTNVTVNTVSAAGIIFK